MAVVIGDGSGRDLEMALCGLKSAVSGPAKKSQIKQNIQAEKSTKTKVHRDTQVG
jgi:hypothetical protein